MLISDELFKELGISSHEFQTKSISIDSRSVHEGDVFIAFGDGHKFVNEALEKGAVAAVIDDPEYTVLGKTILVKSTLEFLKDIGKIAKDSAHFKRVIGITGSVGKTTTRSWINSTLNYTHKSFSSIKNYNTIFGLPLSLSLIDGTYDYGVFEFGSNHRGEISELTNYIKPDVGIITNIYESHIGQFKDTNDLALEKISILEGVNAGGFVIYDGDSRYKSMIEREAHSRGIEAISVGFNESSEIYIKYIYKNEIVIKTPFGELSYMLGCLGRQYVYVSALVIATIYSLGLDVREYLKYIEDLRPLAGRGEVLNFDRFSIIDDSYNASPSSMIAALDRLSSFDANSKIAVLGEMRELGSMSALFHEQVSRKLSDLDLKKVFFVGSKELWGIMNAGREVICFEELDNISIEKILKIVQNKSVILLKGSRSIGLEKFIEYVRRTCFTI